MKTILRDFILKPAGRTKVPLKYCTRQLKKTPSFKRPAYFNVTIIGGFDRFTSKGGKYKIDVSQSSVTNFFF